jgi:hypothetical protein
MADDKKSLDELAKALAELAKTPKAGGGIASMGSGVFDPPIDWKAALEALTRARDQETKAAAQKVAAETNKVDAVAANAWFKDHWPKPRKCPICTTEDNWGLTTIFSQIPMGPVGTHQPVRTFPAVVVTCRHCGHVIFFNALVMGLLLPKEQG